jgi:N-glycosylase/DNA lyase
MKHLIDYANVIDNLVDLFMLSNCPYIITSPGSSWSEFAKYYKDKESDNILDVNKKLEQSDYIHTILASKRKTNFI